MKNALVVLAALSVSSGLACAQGSVTLFGIVDAAATSVKNGSAGTRKTLSSGQSNTSRIGFRGVEDLGGGLKASFWLEGQVDVDTGGSSAFDWQRRATISLSGSWGELRLGRDQNPSYLNWVARDLWGYVGVGTTANLRSSPLTLGGATTGVRTSNSVTYFLPEGLGGLYGSVMVGAGEGATGNKYIGTRVGYRMGELDVSAASGKTAKTGAMLDALSTMNIGATYRAPFGNLLAAYEKDKYSTLERSLVTLGVRVPVGSGEVKAQWARSSGTGAAATPNQFDATLFSAGYDYNLSKRSLIYVNFGNIDNGGSTTTGATFTATGNGPAGIKRGETSTGYQVGVRHNF